MSSAWSLRVGRTTYQRFADYWPKQDPNPITEALNSGQKYVASTTLTEPLPWPNSTLLRGDATKAVARLKDELDENLVVFGSGLLGVDYASLPQNWALGSHGERPADPAIAHCHGRPMAAFGGGVHDVFQRGFSVSLGSWVLGRIRC